MVCALTRVVREVTSSPALHLEKAGEGLSKHDRRFERSRQAGSEPMTQQNVGNKQLEKFLMSGKSHDLIERRDKRRAKAC